MPGPQESAGAKVKRVAAPFGAALKELVRTGAGKTIAATVTVIIVVLAFLAACSSDDAQKIDLAGHTVTLDVPEGWKAEVSTLGSEDDRSIVLLPEGATQSADDALTEFINFTDRSGFDSNTPMKAVFLGFTDCKNADVSDSETEDGWSVNNGATGKAERTGFGGYQYAFRQYIAAQLDEDATCDGSFFAVLGIDGQPGDSVSAEAVNAARQVQKSVRVD